MEKYSYRKFRFIMSIDIFYATLVGKSSEKVKIRWIQTLFYKMFIMMCWEF